MDIWQVGKSYVDIWFPPSDAQVPQPLREIRHTTSQIPLEDPHATPRPLAEDWRLDSLGNSTFHSTYHPLYEIDAFLHELVELRPDIVRLVNLGHSGEGREMMGITISTDEPAFAPPRRRKGKNRKGQEEEVPPKLGFVVVGAQHAREVSGTRLSGYFPC